VNEDEVVLLGELGRVGPRVGEVGRLLVTGQRARRALQPIVDGLRDVEERLVAADDLPVGDNAEILEQRNDRAE
jgi:hypothetical protein